MRLPFERFIVVGIAQGRSLKDIHPEYAHLFLKMTKQIGALFWHTKEESVL
jgi:hypothetical protein